MYFFPREKEEGREGKQERGYGVGKKRESCFRTREVSNHGIQPVPCSDGQGVV